MDTSGHRMTADPAPEYALRPAKRPRSRAVSPRPVVANPGTDAFGRPSGHDQSTLPIRGTEARWWRARWNRPATAPSPCPSTGRRPGSSVSARGLSNSFGGQVANESTGIGPRLCRNPTPRRPESHRPPRLHPPCRAAKTPPHDREIPRIAFSGWTGVSSNRLGKGCVKIHSQAMH